jgi:hypothetical protein
VLGEQIGFSCVEDEDSLCWAVCVKSQTERTKGGREHWSGQNCEANMLQIRANRRSFDYASRDETARGFAQDDTVFGVGERRTVQMQRQPQPFNYA